MKCRLVKIDNLSGECASIYTVLMEDGTTLFDQFLKNNASLKSEIKDIVIRLKTIGHKTGAREGFFKLGEGPLSEYVCALYDKPDKKLRLYAIRYSTLLIVLGSGGEKPKGMKKFQESRILTEANYFLNGLSKIINKRISDNDIRFFNNGKDFKGDLEFYNNEDEE